MSDNELKETNGGVLPVVIVIVGGFLVRRAVTAAAGWAPSKVYNKVRYGTWNHYVQAPGK